MAEPLRVYLEFEGSEDPIAGTVTSGQERRPFTGWLGLLAGLENAIGRERDGCSSRLRSAPFAS